MIASCIKPSCRHCACTLHSTSDTPVQNCILARIMSCNNGVIAHPCLAMESIAMGQVETSMIILTDCQMNHMKFCTMYTLCNSIQFGLVITYKRSDGHGCGSITKLLEPSLIAVCLFACIYRMSRIDMVGSNCFYRVQRLTSIKCKVITLRNMMALEMVHTSG